MPKVCPSPQPPVPRASSLCTPMQTSPSCADQENPVCVLTSTAALAPAQLGGCHTAFWTHVFACHLIWAEILPSPAAEVLQMHHFGRRTMSRPCTATPHCTPRSQHRRSWPCPTPAGSHALPRNARSVFNAAMCACCGRQGMLCSASLCLDLAEARPCCGHAASQFCARICQGIAPCVGQSSARLQQVCSQPMRGALSCGAQA